MGATALRLRLQGGEGGLEVTRRPWRTLAASPQHRALSTTDATAPWVAPVYMQGTMRFGKSFGIVLLRRVPLCTPALAYPLSRD